MKKTKDERDYHGWIASLPCSACGDKPVHVHHVRIHGKRDNNHWFAIPLCPSCHQGNGGVHLAPKVFDMRTGGEYKLLADTIAKLWDKQ